MISCRFIYKFKTGGASDSLNRVHQIHSVPRVGETLFFVGAEASALKNIVKEVVHCINPSDGTHEIRVYYGDGAATE